ncbi:hypothetical protein BDR07DRAFT_1479926 [Suillus spraguei]|nr:hypothetical protein BDR07DRAFT_1479926 [Suillus spraguei]
MDLLNDGVYSIRNIDSGLMLDLQSGWAEEGTTIQGYTNNGSEAQQWLVKDQNVPGQPKTTFSIQSNRWKGSGFFATKDGSNLVVYTKQAFVVSLVKRVTDGAYTISFTVREEDMVLSIPGDGNAGNAVKVEKYVEGNRRQLWIFDQVASLRGVGA